MGDPVWLCKLWFLAMRLFRPSNTLLTSCRSLSVKTPLAGDSSTNPKTPLRLGKAVTTPSQTKLAAAGGDQKNKAGKKRSGATLQTEFCSASALWLLRSGWAKSAAIEALEASACSRY